MIEKERRRCRDAKYPLGGAGIAIRQKTMEYLGIGHVEIANRIVQRDRHAEFVMWMANAATTLDKICTDRPGDG